MVPPTSTPPLDRTLFPRKTRKRLQAAPKGGFGDQVEPARERGREGREEGGGGSTVIRSQEAVSWGTRNVIKSKS